MFKSAPQRYVIIEVGPDTTKLCFKKSLLNFKFANIRTLI